MAEILRTARLALRELEETDAPFILQLLNTREFIDNIGDRQVRSLDDAARYIDNVRASYRSQGFGLWHVGDRATGAPLGICGLLKRDHLEHPDVGYALLPTAFGRGIATEAAAACVAHGRAMLGMQQICAIVAPHNSASIRVLEKIGLHHARDLPGATPGEVLKLFI
jgi:RimJ/RimL family protein N-acetyltransferase